MSHALLPRLARRALAALLAIAAIALPAAAGDRFRYASGLADLRYFDLAAAEFRAMTADASLPAADRAAGRLGLARVRKLEASAEPDGLKRLAAFREAEAGFLEFVASGAEHPLYLLAVFELAECLQDRSALIADILEQDVEGVDAAGLRADAARSISLARDRLREAIDLLERIPSRSAEDEARLEKAKFYSAIQPYFLARVAERGGPEWRRSLLDAERACEDYVWAFEGRLSAYHALLYKGKAHADLSLEARASRDYEDAIACFDGVAALAEAPGAADYQDLVERSVLEAAKLMNAWGRHADAAAKVRSLVDVLKRTGDRPLGAYGRLAEVELARAQRGLGDAAEAVKTAREVAETSRGTAAGRAARGLVREWLGGGGGADVLDPRAFAAAGDAADAEGDRFAAIRSYQRAIELIPKDPGDAERKLRATLHHRLGVIYRAMRRDFEAGLSFRQAASECGAAEEPLRESSLAAARSAFAAHYKATRSPADKVEAERARADYDAAYPDRADEFTAALERFEEADAAADSAEAARLFDEAKALFEKASDGPRGDRARVQAGLCEYEKGARVDATRRAAGAPPTEPPGPAARAAYDACLRAFDAYVAWGRENAPRTEAETLERRQGVAAADFYRGRARLALGEPEKAIAYLAGYAERHRGLDSLVPSGVYFAIRCSIELARWDDAERDLAVLREEYATSPLTADALARVGRALSDAADSASQDPARRARADAWRAKSAEYLAAWLDAGNRTFDQAIAVAKNDFFDKGDYAAAERVLARLIEKHRDDPSVRDSAERWLNLRVLLARSRVAQRKYAEALPLCEELVREKNAVLGFKMDLAECHGGTIVLDAKTNEVTVSGGVGDLDAALALGIEVANGLKRADRMGSKEWWHAKWYCLYLLVRKGQRAEAAAVLENAKLSGPDASNREAWRWAWLDRELK